MKRIAILLILALTGCGHDLVVQSNPDNADVYLIAPRSEDRKFVGRTPLEIDLDQIADVTHQPPSSREYVKMVVSLKDYNEKEFLIPVGTFGTYDTTIKAKLMLTPPRQDNSKLVVQYLMNAQDLVNIGDLDRANLEIDRAVNLEPGNPWSYIMRGHIYLLKKDYVKSLAAYEKSVELDPENQMILKRIVNVRQFLKENINEKK